MRFFIRPVLILWIFLQTLECFAQSSPSIAIDYVSELTVNLSWQSSGVVQISYRRTDVPSNWIIVSPSELVGAKVDTSSGYGGIVAPGTASLTVPSYGTYVFRVAQCAVFPLSDRGGSLTLLCGQNQRHFHGVYNGAVAETNSIFLPFHSAYEFSQINPVLSAVGTNSIRAVALNQFGRVQIDWNVSESFVEIQRYELGKWGSATPTDVFPTFIQNAYPSGSFRAIYPKGSVSQVIHQPGEYKYRVRGCRYQPYRPEQPPTLQCGAYIESAPFRVESLGTSNLPPLVAINSPSINSQFTTGQTVTVKVSATDPDISGTPNTSSQIAKVEFYQTNTTGQFIAASPIVYTATSLTNGYYQYSFKPSAPGDYYLIAVATDTDGAKNHAVTSIRVVAPTANVPQPNNTTPVNFDRYAVYYGDFDEDGHLDIYFHGRDLTIILHGDIPTPIVLQAPAGFAYFGGPGGSYRVASEWDMTDEAVKSCPGCRLAKEGEDYIFGDVNKDGNPDVLVLGQDKQHSSLLISGTEGTELPQILAEIMGTGQVRQPGQPASATPYFTDNLRERSPAIVAGKIVVDGIGHTIANILQADSQGASLATSQNIVTPEAPVIPSPTLNAVDLAEIDALSSLGGEFRVNEAGAATYKVPLALPVGTAGVAPEISLNYSSQAGIGNMGLGWSLSAGSSISRCRQTLQVDGKVEPIKFRSSDRFCLDSQRLLLVSGTEYGAVNAIYIPEIDNGTIVTSIGGILGHPAKFIVTAKDGSTSILGGDNDHPSEVVGTDAAGTKIKAREPLIKSKFSASYLLNNSQFQMGCKKDKIWVAFLFVLP